MLMYRVALIRCPLPAQLAVHSYAEDSNYDQVTVHSCSKSARLPGHSCCLWHKSALLVALTVGVAMLYFDIREHCNLGLQHLMKCKCKRHTICQY